MINYINKGNYLIDAIGAAGHGLVQDDGVWISSDDIAVQAIIDSFDPLPPAQTEAKTLVKEASAAKRLQYVTQAAGKDAEYTFKAQEANQYNLDNSVGVFMQARMDATSETAATVAAEWTAKSAGWQAVGAAIAAIEDKSSQDIDAETDWQQCDVIAKSAVDSIEAI
jgi:hypothetical protein